MRGKPTGRKCAHCGQDPGSLSGGMSGPGEETRYLCHPDEGMDCYHLVTVYHHEMPCTLTHGDNHWESW